MPRRQFDRDFILVENKQQAVARRAATNIKKSGQCWLREVRSENAPSLKYQPKDKFTEVIIFAGMDAYAHAQHWIESEGRKHGDNVPPVYRGQSNWQTGEYPHY